MTSQTSAIAQVLHSPKENETRESRPDSAILVLTAHGATDNHFSGEEPVLEAITYSKKLPGTVRLEAERCRKGSARGTLRLPPCMPALGFPSHTFTTRGDQKRRESRLGRGEHGQLAKRAFQPVHCGRLSRQFGLGITSSQQTWFSQHAASYAATTASRVMSLRLRGVVSQRSLRAEFAKTTGPFSWFENRFLTHFAGI